MLWRKSHKVKEHWVGRKVNVWVQSHANIYGLEKDQQEETGERNQSVRRKTKSVCCWKPCEEIYSSKLNDLGPIFVRQLSNKGKSFAQTEYSFPNLLCLNSFSLSNFWKPLTAADNKHFLLWNQQHSGCFPNLGCIEQDSDRNWAFSRAGPRASTTGCILGASPLYLVSGTKTKAP